MSCHKLNKQNESGDDKCEEYEEENEIPEYVAEKFWQFESQHKSTLEEIETVNLGDQECVKEVKIIVHLSESQTKDLIYLLTAYIDIFVWVYSDILGLSKNVVSHKLPINLELCPVKPKDQEFKP